MDWNLLEKQLRDMEITGASLEIAPHDHLNPGHGWRCTLTDGAGRRHAGEGSTPLAALQHLIHTGGCPIAPPAGPFGSNLGDEAALFDALADLNPVIETGSVRVYLPGERTGCIEARWETGASRMWEVELLGGDGFHIETRDARAQLSEVVACVRTLYADYAEDATASTIEDEHDAGHDFEASCPKCNPGGW